MITIYQISWSSQSFRQ